MLTRREVRRSQRTSTATSRPAVRRLSAIGITTWFDTMVETAMAATITIEAAEEKPPRKARSARSCRP